MVAVDPEQHLIPFIYSLFSPCTVVSFNAGNVGRFPPKLNGHQGGKGPKIRTGLPGFPEEFKLTNTFC